MESNELMIGDWVRNDLGETQQVVELREEGVMLYYNDIYPYDDIRPIPLTPEILEKNGFKKRENDIYHIGPRYVLAGDVEDYLVIVMPEDPPIHGVKFLTEIHTNCVGKSGVNKLHNCDIEYVHQLQHALRLCRITKEIQI